MTNAVTRSPPAGRRWDGVEPDIVILSKGLGGGYTPVAALHPRHRAGRDGTGRGTVLAGTGPGGGAEIGFTIPRAVPAARRG